MVLNHNLALLRGGDNDRLWFVHISAMKAQWYNAGKVRSIESDHR